MKIIRVIYRLFCIFFLLFFPKQITDVICYGRHRDKENIKSRRGYYFIYTFWFLFFGVFCLMMGSAAGVDPTFDRVVDYYDLNSGKCDYREADSFYDEEGKKQGDFTLVYYIRKNEPHVAAVILQIVEENKSLRYHDQLTELKATYQSDGTYFLYGKGKMLARVKVENAGLLKKVSYQWDRKQLELLD